MTSQPDARKAVSLSKGWLAAGAAAVAASFGVVAVLSGYGVAESSLLAGSAGVVTGGLLPPAALLVGSGLLATAAAASAAAAASSRLGWAKSATTYDITGKEETWEPEPQPQSSTAADPLLAVQYSGQGITLDAAQTEAGVVEDTKVSTSSKPRKLPRHVASQRRQMLDEARKEAEAWIAALILYGVSVKVAGESRELRLESEPAWDTLVLGEEQLPLMGLAFRLDGSTLTLACEEEESTAEQCERTFELRMASENAALALTLALKLLRGKADTGAGVAAWGSRPLDRLERPPPAE